MGATILLVDDTTPATGLTFSAAAGSTSATQTFHVWFNKGVPGGAAASVRASVEVEDPGNPGTWLKTGLPALDEQWLEARINGGDNNAGATGWVPEVTDWYRVGTNSFLPIPDIPGDTARYLEIRFHPPLKDGVATETVTWRLVLSYSDNAFGVSTGLSEQGAGILTGIGDRTVREFVDAPAVTETGTPDDYVHVAKCWFVHDGIPYRRSAVTDLQLNQNDGAAQALTAGQAYIAVISQPPGDGTTGVAAVATKGLRAAAASAVAPTLPAGNLLIATVAVVYQAGGTSVINTANITGLCYSGRYALSGVGTTTLKVGPGRALLNGSFLRDTVQQTFTPTAAATRWYWLTAGGSIEATTTAAAPAPGALPLCKVVKTANIDTITDLRGFLEPNAEPVRLAFAGTETAGANKARARMDHAFVIDRVTAAVRVASIGATGSTDLDVHLDATTIYGTKPSIAAQALADDASYPITTASAAAWLSLDVDAITTGGTQAVDIEVIVWTYPLARVA